MRFYSSFSSGFSGFEEEDSLKNLQILSFMVRLENILSNLLCVFDDNWNTKTASMHHRLGSETVAASFPQG